MSNIVVSSCPVVAASYVPPAPRRPLLVTPSSTHFKAVSYILGVFFTALCILFLVIQLISTPTTHPLTLHSDTLTATLSFFLTKRVREYAGCQLQGAGLGFPAHEGKFPFAGHNTKSFYGFRQNYP